MNPAATPYFTHTKLWPQELTLLRSIVLTTTLQETIKWKQPCYTMNEANVLMLASFKDYCSVAFFKGVLITDTHNVLIQQGAHTQATRILKYTSTQQIHDASHIIKDYIQQAIAIEAAGTKLPTTTIQKEALAPELIQALASDMELSQAFTALTPGRQRAYNLYILAAAQASTRLSRIAKYTPKILAGQGINDCTCGLSAKMPYCDGSHKYATP